MIKEQEAATSIVDTGKKIAKFMGSKTVKSKDVAVYKWEGDFKPLQGKLSLDKNLMFHNDWNWVMPVLDKIREIAAKDINVRTELKKYDFMDWNYRIGLTVTNNIEGVFREIGIFIDWHAEYQGGFIINTIY